MAFSTPVGLSWDFPPPPTESVRTDRRTDGRSRDYYVRTKISWIDSLPYFLSNGAPLAALPAGSAKNMFVLMATQNNCKQPLAADGQDGNGLQLLENLATFFKFSLRSSKNHYKLIKFCMSSSWCSETMLCIRKCSYF